MIFFVLNVKKIYNKMKKRVIFYQVKLSKNKLFSSFLKSFQQLLKQQVAAALSTEQMAQGTRLTKPIETDEGVRLKDF